MGISSPLVDLQHQYDLLQKEYEYEKETYRQQSERTGLRKRVAQGLCWYPVTPGRSYYNSLNQLVIEIERTEDREIEHNFEYGRPVCFFTADISGKFKYLDFSATISYVQEDRMVVVLPTPSALMDIQGKSNDLGVQLYFDETSYKTMFSALSDVMRAKNNQHNELESAPEVSGRGILRLDTPIVWFDTSECDFTENTREETMSRVNRQEAELLVEQLRSYIQKISKERVLEENIDFGLISPYKAQVQYIRKLIKQDAFFKPLRRLITVHTVDGFQGQERDVILISLVRANEDGKIGFLNDLRRMNVAITRARMKLMILGDASTLTRHAFYKELYNYISQRGKIITINTKQEHEL